MLEAAVRLAPRDARLARRLVSAQMAAGDVPASVEASQAVWDGFQGGYLPVLFHAAAMGLGALAIWKGVSSIERVSKVLIPALFVIVLVAVVRAVTLPGSGAGLAFLFTPQWDLLARPSTWLEALTQNAWDTGAGWGLILTYGAYMQRQHGVVKNAFITGIGGQDGTYLAERLVAEGLEVHALVLETDGHPEHCPAEVVLHSGDLADVEATRRLVAEIAPQEVYNLAAISSVAQSWDEPDRTSLVNGHAAVALMESARRVGGVRLVQASSAEIFGEAQDDEGVRHAEEPADLREPPPEPLDAFGQLRSALAEATVSSARACSNDVPGGSSSRKRPSMSVRALYFVPSTVTWASITGSAIPLSASLRRTSCSLRGR